MSSIFGDTDDITFGSSPKSLERTASVKKEFSPRPSSSFHDERKRNTFAPHRESPRRSESSLSVPDAPSLAKSLSGLIDSMKPSFLPNMPENTLRLVILSDASSTDPMMLVRSDDVTLILGTGFSTLENAGKTYPTFPDMRLISSERDRLAGWVLTKSGFDISLFSTLLESLGFPFVYGTRDVIAYIRNSIKDTNFIEKCRFFEIFTLESPERKIAQFVLKPTSTGLSLQVGTKGIIDTLHPIEGTLSGATITLRKEGGVYLLGETEASTGEIIDVSSAAKIAKQTLRFTFDTFYVDAGSIGVVAGYTLRDRGDLATSGVLTFVIEEDIRMRAIVGHIFIDSRGFVHSYEMMSVHKDILRAIRHIYESTILGNRSIERGELVGTLRRELTKYCYLLTGRTPVVMPVIIER